MWRLSDHKERTGGAPGREVGLLSGGTQQKGPRTNTLKRQLRGRSEWIFNPAVWKLKTGGCLSKKDDLFTHKITI